MTVRPRQGDLLLLRCMSQELAHSPRRQDSRNRVEADIGARILGEELTQIWRGETLARYGRLQARLADRRPRFGRGVYLRLRQRLEALFNLQLRKSTDCRFHDPICAA